MNPTTSVRTLGGAFDVLLVEDDPKQSAEFEDFFKRLPVTYRVVSNGQQAIDMLDRIEPKVVILDIRLPGADGITVAKAFLRRRDRPAVVLMSGHVDSVYEANQSSVKVFPVVEKPIDLRVLGRFIKDALGDPGTPAGVHKV